MPSAYRELLRIVIPMFVVWVVIMLLGGWWAILLGIPLFAVICFTGYFFRDPEREIPNDLSAIVAAADGIVTAIDEVEEGPFNQGRVRRISVFLSVFDVHINRLPYQGTIRQVQHTPGEFLDVRLPKSELLNERQDWLLETPQGVLVVRQIAGLVARRIVGWAKEGETLEKGFRFGMIRFGSRTEIYLPLRCEVEVAVGEKVEGGSTIVARWRY
jgi:phosphatidylserine decarboxylase